MRFLAFTASTVLASLAPTLAAAHEAGAPFSGAILDPLVLHHAHIENEQRLNLTATRTGAGSGLRRVSFGAELELSWAAPSYDFGVEAFLPFSNLPDSGAGRVSGVGDIALRPIKFSPWMSRETVLTFATELVLPTGSTERGLGEGYVAVGELLFVDLALGNWFLGINAGVIGNVNGRLAPRVEYGAAASYSFIEETRAGGIAPAVPRQPVVVSASLEVLAESALGGREAGRSPISVLPGLSLWWPASGMQLRAGVERPVYGAPDDWAFMLQMGNHRRWNALFADADAAVHR